MNRPIQIELAYPFATPPEAGELRQLAAGVYWLRMPLPIALNHINLWLIADGEGWVIVDTGLATDEIRGIWQQVFSQLNGPVTRVIVTHFHPDHLGLAGWLLEQFNVPLLMSAGEYLSAHLVCNQLGGLSTAAMIEQFRANGLEQPHLDAFAAMQGGYKASLSTLPLHYQRLRDLDHVEIGAHRWQVICGYGHSPEHVSLYCPELNLFIAGDMLLPKISTNISVFAVNAWDDALGYFLDSLNRYAELLPPSTLVLPSHGLPFVGVQTRVAALHAHHDEHLKLTLHSCSTAKSAREIMQVLFDRELSTYQIMFAMGESIAHLNHLVHNKRLLRTQDAQGIYRFQQN